MKCKTRSLLSAALFITLAFVEGQGQDRLQRSKSFTVSKGGTLEVSIDGGDIRIATWEKNEVLVNFDSYDAEEADRLSITHEGNTVRIKERDRRGYGRNRFEVTVPSGFNLDLKTSYGDIRLAGPLAGNVNGRTSGGDMDFADVEGNMNLNTAGGDVRTGKITGNASLSTSGGDIRVRSSSGNLNVKTSGGDIVLGNIGKNLNASTAGGDIKIGNVGGEANISTSGGDIRVGKVMGNVSLNTAGGDIILDGGTGSIKASTSGGDITLRSITGSTEAKTSGGDILAELTPTGNDRSSFTSSGGDIRLYLPESARATIEVTIKIQDRWGKTDRTGFDIRSDFKAESVTRENRQIRGWYILNGGGEVITIKTVNSDVEIRKLRK